MPHGASRARAPFPWPTEREPRPTLSRDQIIDAALRVADTEGLEALSMRRLGQELDAGATSLYWYVRNKDELLDLIVDRVIGEVIDEIRPADSWDEDVREAARALRRVLLRHRHVASVVGTRPTVGPHALEAMEWLLGRIRAGGADLRTAVLAAQSVTNWAAGFAVFESRDPLGVDATEDDRRAFTDALGQFIASLPAERFPNTLEMLGVSATLTPDDQFEYGLQRLVSGIAADLEPR